MSSFSNLYKLRKAVQTDSNLVWEILQEAILKRKNEGSTQWQDGYPNEQVVVNDIANGEGYVVETHENILVAYIVVSERPEPAFEELKTGWLTFNTPYLVMHRLAITQNPKIKGLATWILQQVEKIAQSKNITSLKVDTNFDNFAMLHIFKKLDYVYCGEVFYRGSPRKAFEKLIK
nr:GNAT family N-acetyltransferase [uncultured Flavobacterium sp.]